MENTRERLSFVHCLLYWEQRSPDAVWMTQPQPDGRVVDYTWRDAANEVRRMAAHLHSLELPAGSRIALVGKNSAHWIMADLAITMAGHISVPIYFTINADTMAYVLAHSEAALIFIGKLDGKSDSWNDFRKAIPATLPTITLPMAPAVPGARAWDALVAASQPLTNADIPEPAIDDVATIMYTSGSTGRPKGVMHSHRTLVTTAQYMKALYTITQEDRMLSYLPLAHTAERCLVESASLFYGFRIYFAGNTDTFVDDLRRARPTLFFSVPRLWVKFQQGINRKLSPRLQKLVFGVPVVSRLAKRRVLQMLGLDHVRAALTGSAPLPPEVLSWYRKLGLELLEGYAMTENFAYSHANRPGRTRVGYVGEACPDVECRIDSNGEVLVKSPCTMLGYYKDPQKTAEDIRPDGFLHTGDMGELDDMGRLRITGRIKDLFKTSKGKYVAPVPIEQKLGESRWIEAVCVGGGTLSQPVAFVMLAEEVRTELGQGQSRSELEQALAALLREVNEALEAHEQLAFLMVAREPWTIENGLLTPTLKIRRHAIEAHYQPRLDVWSRVSQTVVWE